MPKPKTVVATYQPITVRFPTHLYDEICDVAAEEDRSKNEQVVRIVRQRYSEKARKKVSTLDEKKEMLPHECISANGD
jgi:hypothetical protein